MRTTILVAALCAGCDLSPVAGLEGPTSFGVRVEGSDLGEDVPLPFAATGGLDFDLVVWPVGGPFDGWITILAEPGLVTELRGSETSGNHARIALADGEEARIGISIVLAYGRTRVWVVDEGYLPASGTPACADGADNDADGRMDFGQDPGCTDGSDGSEEGGSCIVGVANPLFYVNPRVSDVQGSGTESPLMDRAVTIDRGRLVVTRISTEGFHVTDIDPAAPAGGSNSLYVYNYQTPWHLRECDVVTNLSGIVGEFYGYTELQFPSWDVLDPEGRVADPESSAECPIPEPVVLTAVTADDWGVMEGLESALVRIVDGRIGDTFRDCDLDRNGEIETMGPEDDCRDACGDDAECTEVSQYRKYGQYSVILDGCRGAACTSLFVVTRDAVPEFWADLHADEVIPAITGTVKHFQYARPPWIVEARCPDDLVCDGPFCGSPEVKAEWDACVPPYARGEYQDDN